MVANMGVSYPQLLKDVGGNPVGEYWPVCMPPCVQFPALEKERGQLYHRGVLMLKEKKEIPTVLGLCLDLGWSLEWQCYSMSLRAIFPHIKLCQGSYHGWLRALMPVHSHFLHSVRHWTFRFPLKCHVFVNISCLSVPKSLCISH